MTPSAVVTEGLTVTLTCTTSCPLTDSTNYIWYMNGQPLPENLNKHLVLDPVIIEHAGNYSCSVLASQNITSAEENLTVRGEFDCKFQFSTFWSGLEAVSHLNLQYILMYLLFQHK